MTQEKSNKMILDNCSKEGLAQGWFWEFEKRKQLEQEIDRLNNIIKELSKDVDMWNKKYNEQFNIINELEKTLKQDIYKLDDKENPLFYEDSFIKYETERRLTYMYILDKLKELKENK